MVVEFGNVERVYNKLEGELVRFVESSEVGIDLADDVEDLVSMGSLKNIENMSNDHIESTLRYLVETTRDFTELENPYDATVLLTVLYEYKMEWLKGAPILSTTWGGYVSSYTRMFSV